MTAPSFADPALTLGEHAQLACVLEATARKPGNVHRSRDFDDAGYLDFILSAAAMVRPIDQARALGVGATVLAAVESTRRLVATNTNLGVVLLIAPLAAVDPSRTLADGVGAVLDALTINDAKLAYQAIRLARPGGLGATSKQDIAHEPTVTLLDAMRLASDRDLVARQYATCYHDLFHVAVPILCGELARGRAPETAIIACALGVHAAIPDTLIARKRGLEVAREASIRARAVLDLDWPDDLRGAAALSDFDAWLRADGHARNPGATADLAAAAIFVALRNGSIRPPFRFDPIDPNSGLYNPAATRDDDL